MIFVKQVFQGIASSLFFFKSRELVSACHPRREIWPEADSTLRVVGENPAPAESQCRRKNEGALREQ